MKKYDISKLVITEYPDTNKWTINYDKYNDETDIEIPSEIAKVILFMKGSLKDGKMKGDLNER